MGRRTVRFTKQFRMFDPGDTASVGADVAQQWVELGVAEYIDPEAAPELIPPAEASPDPEPRLRQARGRGRA